MNEIIKLDTKDLRSFNRYLDRYYPIFDNDLGVPVGKHLTIHYHADMISPESACRIALRQNVVRLGLGGKVDGFKIISLEWLDVHTCQITIQPVQKKE